MELANWDWQDDPDDDCDDKIGLPVRPQPPTQPDEPPSWADLPQVWPSTG